jgi:putative tryptophan/tyrosine transport system substrate-binding protein
MRRREFITLLVGGAAVAWPFAARAQQPATPVIGMLNGGMANANAFMVTALRRGLSEMGYVEGRNVAIEYRWAEDQQDRLPALAADLVQRRVAVIAAGPTQAALATKAATTSIPIFFQTGRDPIADGLVASFNRPGGNVTGVSQLALELGAKRLDLLHKLIPNARLVAGLAFPQNLVSRDQLADLQQAAQPLGMSILVLNINDDRDLEPAFAHLIEQRADALVVSGSGFFFSRRDRLAALAARHAIPTVYQSREFTFAGGLMSYGGDFSEVYRQIGVYVGRILKGEKPADLPVVQPNKLELVINLKTATALSITFPPGLLAIADEVIE